MEAALLESAAVIVHENAPNWIVVADVSWVDPEFTAVVRNLSATKGGGGGGGIIPVFPLFPDPVFTGVWPVILFEWYRKA